MLPVGILMIEHRLIERAVPAMEREIRRINKGGEPSGAFLSDLVGFMREYADRCHHGKEEDILFRGLKGKDMSPDLTRIMGELEEEHRTGRAMVGELERLKGRYSSGERLSEELAALLGRISSFYVAHIEKEDKHFFLQSMDYLDPAQRTRMLEEFYRFDKTLFDKPFRSALERLG